VVEALNLLVVETLNLLVVEALNLLVVVAVNLLVVVGVNPQVFLYIYKCKRMIGVLNYLYYCLTKSI
jgi:hypothetical protein